MRWNGWESRRKEFSSLCGAEEFERADVSGEDLCGSFLGGGTGPYLAILAATSRVNGCLRLLLQGR